MGMEQQPASGDGQPRERKKYGFGTAGLTEGEKAGHAEFVDKGGFMPRKTAEGELEPITMKEAEEMPELTKLFTDIRSSQAAIDGGYNATVGPRIDAEMIAEAQTEIIKILEKQGRGSPFPNTT